MIAEIDAVVGHRVVMSGYGQDFEIPITAIEFSANEGRQWTRYEVDSATAERNVNWRFEFVPPKIGRYHLLVRAVRADGKVSPQTASVSLVVHRAFAGSVDDQSEVPS